MSICFQKNTKEFHLSNGFISYIFKVLENGSLGHMYFGKKIREREDFGHLIEYVRRDMACLLYTSPSPRD